MSSENNDLPESEVEGQATQESDGAEMESVNVETDELSEVEALQEEVALAKDAALRAQADAINAQRRAELDVEKARKFALERFANDLLPVVDNLERALESSAGSDADGIVAVVEGVELTLKSLVDVLAKNGITPVDPHGEPFDPQVAQAMSMVENPDVEPNTVIAVMQKGYLLKDRLLRPAMVMVSKASS